MRIISSFRYCNIRKSQR